VRPLRGRRWCFKQQGLCGIELDPRVNPSRSLTGTEFEVEVMWLSVEEG
jgi:hypothetical protein